jgi:hypothetical protein
MTMNIPATLGARAGMAEQKKSDRGAVGIREEP